MTARRICSLLLLICAAVQSPAQQPELTSRTPDRIDPLAPTIAFTFTWEQFRPNHYAIVVDSAGRATYESQSTDPATASAAGDTYMFQFVLSEANRARIFELARLANFFQGDFDLKRRVAFTGIKTLAYAGPERQSQTSYNVPTHTAIRQLTEIFQGISTTLESARRLTHTRRYDRLGLDNELKNMENLAKSGSLYEVQAIAPLLRDIATDRNVLHVAQQRARRLLMLAEKQGSAASAP
ncbi:MAG TPA: hypothetical protein VGQ71_06285 [Terriglobales bacterium]|jgi:hypothetical protein|nr:hypothetical protein [Terriglobales bacterium]